MFLCTARKISLCAFSVDNTRTRFIIFFFLDPHIFEGGEGSKDGSSNPDRVFSFWWSNNLDLHGLWSLFVHFIFQTLVDLVEHGGTSGHNGVCVKISSDINMLAQLAFRSVPSLLVNAVAHLHQ